MNPLQSALDDIHAAEVALREGHKRLALDFLQDAQDALKRELNVVNMPQRITVMPNVELCAALEKELGQI